MEKKQPWWKRRENILTACGLVLTAAVFIAAELGFPFHYEFLILAAGLCGLGIAQWGVNR